jgi:hypothetical protein
VAAVADAGPPRDATAATDAGHAVGSGGGGSGGSTGSCSPASRACKAALDDAGVLFLSCTRGNELSPYCSSRLTVMQ